MPMPTRRRGLPGGYHSYDAQCREGGDARRVARSGTACDLGLREGHYLEVRVCAIPARLNTAAGTPNSRHDE